MNSVLGDKKAILILLGPALAVYTLIKLVPVLWSLGLTFFTGNPLSGFEFSGGENFLRFLQDPQALEALWFTVRYSLVITAGQVVLGYALALLYVFVLKNASSFVRTVVFFPTVLPTVAVALLFKSMFAVGGQEGPVNAGLGFLGLGSIDWFATAEGTFAVAVIMELWRSMGFFAILLYAGLVDIPEETLESARLDGATGWRLVSSIVLPLSLPVLLSSVIFSFNSTLKVFDTLLALNNGGPGSSTTPLTLYMYRTVFSYSDYGYGSTIALVLTIMCFLVTLFIFRSSRRDNTKEA
ncbi:MULTISPECIES: carbohydrate ABC transporter permease [Rathayibacter]|uniref:Sugar ABC transporter permease n=1 Tax=Rathayibacter festucae DSM 15932 TaxID=1328866 RepID=A0A3Q9UZA2_9MICO|nr:MULTISPECIES: sugar ABC transporter permease [Rathayibacter]AZZ53909.1 sugar ABC transporter permease [Rathayibacter festucae DSM 15932]MCJ1698826.1 sugar ABC transporter permease [Rathayibacter festucae]MCJ1702443.1 sugar ABC transporter permease [Rathayibacter sp. VKM Ac-2926]MDY0914283.1 sugar ABC transporter permease [Rathayibacter festucae]ROP56880.1 multiple sugar transport system permease protein/raffinose/stachyose/melibiose transport system permease protein [Rathayibacter sp. PhB18